MGDGPIRSTTLQGAMLVALCTPLHAALETNCSVALDDVELERPGTDYMRVANGTLADCVARCCEDPACAAFTFSSPSPISGCGLACCQLKSVAPPPVRNVHGAAVRTGVALHGVAVPGAWPVPPYPRSDFITNISIDWATAQNSGVSGDTWPSAWAADGSAYAMGCDNKQPGHANGTMMWMNWWRVRGNATHVDELTLLNDSPVSNSQVRTVCGAKSGGNIKPSSVIALPDGRLLAGVQCMEYYDSADPSFVGRQRALSTWLITSTDGGKTWDTNATDHAFFGGRLTNPMFIAAGQAQSAAPDEWLYVHFPASSAPETAYWDGNDYILLGRVRPAHVLTRSAYEFRGADGTWYGDSSMAAPVFQHRHMTGQDHTFYQPALRRYIIPNYGFVDPHTGQPVGWHNYYKVTNTAPAGQLALFESQHPWGPWSLFHLEQPWNLEGGHAAYDPDFPAQWASTDGRTLRMISSACCGSPGYSYHATTVNVHCP